ncbi:MAG: hypothetical protein KAS23_15825, partial [Anaerohalosphaera sp.]|nr:hypothetical protein [Anaerohalosphaera sp.]
YGRGEKQIPAVMISANVKKFGAVGDGKADDTQAFIDAIKATKKGAIAIPPGRYRVTSFINIDKPDIVLRGAGTEKTTLFFPVPLEHVRSNMGETTGGRPTSNYSWSGGFISVKGSYRSSNLCGISADASRGDNQLQVTSAKDLHVGRVVELYQHDIADNSLATCLYANDPGSTKMLKGRTSISQVLTITSIKGNTVHFDRPIRFDVKQKWKPVLRRFAPTVTNVGIENMTFEFPNTDYKGHFTELGFNAMAFSNVSNCWARNIKILNCDSGIFLRSTFCNLENITFDSRRKVDNQKCIGHHGITLSGGDNLLTGFKYNVRFIHDITVTSSSSGNVSSNGRGVDICFDHHKRAPYGNLFTNIDIGKGSRMYKCGGGADLGKNCAAYETFWNIRAQLPQAFPPDRFCPDLVNLIAVHTDKPSVKDHDGKWFEAIAPDQIEPKNIHTAQLKRRLRSSQNR